MKRLLAILLLTLTSCSDDDPTRGDIHRQGKVQDGANGNFGGRE